MIRIAWLLFLSLLMAPGAQAQGSIADFRHDAWGAKEGAPPMTLSMAQTKDGWLWLGTYGGLYRFDGVQFERFVPPAGEALTYSAISTLTAAPNGDLLIGYLTGGLSVLHDGHLRHLTSVERPQFSNTFAVLMDLDGSYWVAALDGLLHFDGRTWERIGARWGYPSIKTDNVVTDRFGRLFVSDGKALYLLDRTQRQFHPTGMRSAANDAEFTFDTRDDLWFSAEDRLEPVPPPPGAQRAVQTVDHHAFNSVNRMFDRDGNVWVTSQDRTVCMVAHDRLPAPGPLPIRADDARACTKTLAPQGNVRNMLEDRDGNIWIATTVGLERLRHERLRTIAYHDPSYRTALVRDSRGDVTATAGEPVSRYGVGDTVLHPLALDADVILQRAGSNGTVLLAKRDALIVLGAGARRTIPYPVPGPAPQDRIRRLIAESSDAFWVGWSGHGLWRYADGAWRKPPDAGTPVARAGDAADGHGHVWLGYGNNTVVDWHAGGIRRYEAKDGVDVRVATFIDVQREVVIAGDGGLQVLSGGRFRHLRASDPNALNGVNGLVIAPNGDRWFNAARGLLHVRAGDWQAAMQAPETPLRYDLLDQLDGFPGSAQVGTVATAAGAPDGRMWFAATEGIALYDPRHDHRATAAPAPVIRAVVADGKRFDPALPIRLAPGTEHVDIDFTALSYTIPERTLFRYRLEGTGGDWQAPVATRGVAFAHLGPGDYTFDLQAALAGGAWSRQLATARFTIAPRFTQTWWFFGLCALAAASALALVHRLRVRGIGRRMRERDAARQHERERIARELHDTVLQTNFALLLQVRAAAASAADNPIAGRLATIVDQAQATLAQGRDRVAGLRAQQDADLPFAAALEQLANETLHDSGIALACQVHGRPWPLDTATAAECSAIVAEAVTNARKHAQATQVRIDVRFGLFGCAIAVSDNGRGIAPEYVEGRTGHWGLAGMRERALLLRARLSIDTGAMGTTIRLRVSRWRARARGSMR